MITTEYKTNTKARAVVQRVTDGIIWATIAGIPGKLPFDEEDGWCILKSKKHLRLIFPKKKKQEFDLSLLSLEAQCDCV